MPTRRDFLIGAASLATAALAEKKLAAQSRAGQAWDSGEVVHLLPAASHERFLIKTSFRGPHRAPPVLLAGSRKIPGRGADTLGFFWTFDVTGLEPGRPYTLQILDARGRPLCDPWQLSTLPCTRRQPEERPAADLFVRRRARRPARPQADRRQHTPVPHAGGQAAHARARHVVRSRCGRCQRRPHLLGPAYGARRSARRVAGRKGPRGRVQSRRTRAGYGKRAGLEESRRAADCGAVRNDDAVDACVFPAGRSRLFRERRGGRQARDLPAGSVHARSGARLAAVVLPRVPAGRTSQPRISRRDRRRIVRPAFRRASGR